MEMAAECNQPLWEKRRLNQRQNGWQVDFACRPTRNIAFRKIRSAKLRNQSFVREKNSGIDIQFLACYHTEKVSGNVFSLVFQLKGNAMRVTIRDIARRAGVSVSTVSRALNNKNDVKKEVRERVLATAEDLHYLSNPHARALIAGRSRTLGLIIAQTSAPFLNVVVTGILDTVARHGYSIIVHNTDEEPQRELHAHQKLRQEQVAGMLITSVQSGSAPLRILQEENTPFVLVNRRLDDLETDYTIGDLRHGMKEIVGHLYQLGHRRIAFLAFNPDRFPVSERLAGYKQALAMFGLSFNPNLVRFCDDQIKTIYELTIALMKTANPAPTAIFPYNDWYATAVIHALHELGYRVPQDVSVVGYDDLEIAPFLTPPLTTMTQQAYQIGQAGVEILIERLNWPADIPWTPRHITFTPDLVVRGSTGPCPS